MQTCGGTAQKWVLRRKAADDLLRQVPDLDPILAKVLYARKIDTPERVRAFLAEERELGSPFQLPDMSQAVTRLRQALQRQERIVVYGDFDADGVSATALLVSALKSLGGEVYPYIPDRFSEAYGLNKPALERLHSEGAQLVVTVDCGIRSVEEVAHARTLGLDMIITDHHSVPKELPPALAVVDPKRPDSRYPFRELAGVGVAYRLVDALSRALSRVTQGERPDLDLDQFLDLVALGTVADIVPLRGENRTLARWGLRRMRESKRVGLLALMKVSGVELGKVDSQAIAFRLGPRINAAGRLKHAMLGYDLLVTSSEDQAEKLATELNLINQQRQQLLLEQVEEARELLGKDGGRQLLFVEGPAFHEGIVGLIASRLTDEFYRPALVMRSEGEITRGSARSIEGFHITHALDDCAQLLSRYGGHARAAGFSLPTENLPAFSEQLEGYCAEHLDTEILQRRISADAIVTLDDIDEDTPAALTPLEPCGEGNPEPALATLGLRLLSLRPVGQEGRHLRMEVSDGKRSVSAIAFRQGHLASEYAPGDTIDLIYRPALNEWQGKESLQLVVTAMRSSA